MNKVNCSVYHHQRNDSLEKRHEMLINFLRAFVEKDDSHFSTWKENRSCGFREERTRNAENI